MSTTDNNKSEAIDETLGEKEMVISASANTNRKLPSILTENTDKKLPAISIGEAEIDLASFSQPQSKAEKGFFPQLFSNKSANITDVKKKSMNGKIKLNLTLEPKSFPVSQSNEYQEQIKCMLDQQQLINAGMKTC